MVKRRYGRTSLGCLVGMAFCAAVIYFGFSLGEVLWEMKRDQLVVAVAHTEVAGKLPESLVMLVLRVMGRLTTVLWLPMLPMVLPL